jgi:hypothetical protein
MWRLKDHRIPVTAERTNKIPGARVPSRHQCHLSRAHRSVILTSMDRKHASLTAIRIHHLQVRARHAIAVCGFAARETA